MGSMRAVALAGSLCVHGILVGFMMRSLGWGMGVPGVPAGDAGGAFFADAATEVSDAAPPEPSEPAAVVSPPEPGETLLAPQNTLAQNAMILPLDTASMVVAPTVTLPLPAGTAHRGHRVAVSGGGRVGKPVGMGGGGKGGGGGGSGGNYLAPSYLDNPEPRYPEEARLSQREGAVLLTVVVNEEGRVADIAVLRSSGDEEMDREAVAAVKRWTFHPATAGGEAIAARVQVPVRFRLR
jgi:protein TonB